jgi:fluoride exporter
MTPWVVVAAVAAGALGALARYGVTRLVAAKLPADKLSRAVLIVNVAGSVIAGALLAIPGDLQYIVVGGFCGGLTTFSTWSVESVQLIVDGKSQAAVGNVVVNLAAGILGAVLAFAVTGFIVLGLSGPA